MPLYEYECTTCHRRTEKIQKFSDPEITVCPYCTGHLERVISAPAISFKGGGWYADGYGNAKPKPSSDSASNEVGEVPAIRHHHRMPRRHQRFNQTLRSCRGLAIDLRGRHWRVDRSHLDQAGSTHRPAVGSRSATEQAQDALCPTHNARAQFGHQRRILPALATSTAYPDSPSPPSQANSFP